MRSNGNLKLGQWRKLFLMFKSKFKQSWNIFGTREGIQIELQNLSGFWIIGKIISAVWIAAWPKATVATSSNRRVTRCSSPPSDCGAHRFTTPPMGLPPPHVRLRHPYRLRGHRQGKISIHLVPRARHRSSSLPQTDSSPCLLALAPIPRLPSPPVSRIGRPPPPPCVGAPPPLFWCWAEASLASPLSRARLEASGWFRPTSSQ
jgi:hypothetical protein